MAESTLRQEIDDVWANLETEDTPETPEMAVVADDPEPDVAKAEVATPVTPETKDVAPLTTDATPSLTVDERGRYHRADGTIASKDEVEAFKAGQQPATATPTLEKQPTEPAAPVPEPSKIPFRYRGAGATHELPGAVLDEKGGLYVPAEAVRDVQRLLAGGQQFYSEGHGSFAYVQQLEKQLAETKQSRSLEQTRVSKALDQIDGWAKTFNDGTEEGRVNALTSIVQYLEKYPVTMREVEVEYWKQQAQRGAPQPQAAQPDMARQAEASPLQYPDRSTMEVTHNDFIERAKVLPEFRELAEADWTQFTKTIARRMPMFFRPATAEEAQATGLQVGQIVYDDNVLYEEVVDFRDQVKRERDNARRIAEANKAAAFNKGQTNGTQQAAAPRRTAVAAPPQPEQPQRVSSAKQLREAIDAAWDGRDDD